MAASQQDDFSAGIWRGRKAPANAVYDAVNGLVDDQGLLFRRGAASFYSTSSAGENLRSLSVVYMPAAAANRVLMQGSSSNLFALDGALAPVIVSTGATVLSRPASIGDYAAYATAGSIIYYAGSLKATDYLTGTVTTTAGSKIVTGAGTSWLANADAGMILIRITGSGVGVVKSVDTNTQITLTKPWEGTTGAGASYDLSADYNVSLANLGTGGTRWFVVAAGAGSPRLLVTIGNRVYLTEPDDPFTFSVNLFHEIPANAVIVGAEGMGDAALFFTTAGVWRISNLSLDAVDDAGNVQHIVEQVNKDLALWDDVGLAAWDSGLVVPAIDDVYLASPDFALRSISEGLRPLYRSYVNAGYQPGMASIHRGHYWLPILNGTTLVDTLVCRLDRPTQTPSGRAIWPWTRWSGQASSPAYAALVAEAARQPKLLGLSGTRVTNLTATLDGQGATDADGSNIGLTLTTNDVPLSDATATKLRLRYELVSAGTPTVTAEYSSDQDAGAFTALTVKGGQYGATGGVASSGGTYSWWQVNKRRERIRFRVTFGGTITSVVMRALEVLARPSGKQ